MSTWTMLECDNCGDSWPDDDAPYLEEGVEIRGDWFDHICEGCMESVSYCSWCENNDWSDNMHHCERYGDYLCEDCDDDAHESLDDWDGECLACGFEQEEYEPTEGVWVGVIG